MFEDDTLTDLLETLDRWRNQSGNDSICPIALNNTACRRTSNEVLCGLFPDQIRLNRGRDEKLSSGNDARR